MDKLETLTVSLTQEELFVLLEHLGLSVLLGLDEQTFEDLDEEEWRSHLSIAERGLMARRFLLPTSSGKVEVDSTVLAVVVACAAPERSLIVKRNRAGVPAETYFFHQRRKLIVAHTVPITGIHQFVVLRDKQALVRALWSIIAPGTGVGPLCRDGHLPDSKLLEAREACRQGDAEAALAVLIETDLPPETARLFAQDLAQPVGSSTLVSIEHRGDPSDEAIGFTLFQGRSGMWLLTPELSSQDVVCIRSVSSLEVLEECRTRMAEAF